MKKHIALNSEGQIQYNANEAGSHGPVGQIDNKMNKNNELFSVDQRPKRFPINQQSTAAGSHTIQLN